MATERMGRSAEDLITNTWYKLSSPSDLVTTDGRAFRLEQDVLFQVWPGANDSIRIMLNRNWDDPSNPWIDGGCAGIKNLDVVSA